MNSFERVMNRLQGKPVDRVPNLSIVMMFAAKEIGKTFSDCCKDHRLLAEAALRCHERYGIDMVCAISDSLREAEGFGTQVIFPEEGVPYAAQMRLQDIADIDTLQVIDPSLGRRMTDTVEASAGDLLILPKGLRYTVQDLCEEMIRRGHEVHVVTGIPNYPMGVIYPEYRNGTRRQFF